MDGRTERHNPTDLLDDLYTVYVLLRHQDPKVSDIHHYNLDGLCPSYSRYLEKFGGLPQAIRAMKIKHGIAVPPKEEELFA